MAKVVSVKLLTSPSPDSETRVLEKINSVRKEVYGMYPKLKIDDIASIISSVNVVQKNLMKCMKNN